MTERKVSSERVSEERLREIIAGCEGVQGNLMSHIKHLSGLSTTSDRYLQRLDPATVKAMASELLALRSSVKTEIRIKPLEWERVTESPAFHGDEPKRFWKAANPFGGSSWVNVHTEDFEGEASWGGKKYPNSAAAMNAVEDHLRACVLSAIEAPAAEGEVTESMVQKAWEAYDAKSGYSKPERFRAALTAALKGDRS